MLRGMCNRLVIGCYHCEHCALFWASVEGRMWVGEHLCLRDWIFIVQSGFSIVMFGMSVVCSYLRAGFRLGCSLWIIMLLQ